MEEIEISSWLTLDAVKNEAEVIETVGDLQSGHWQSVFCIIEEDFLELGYMDTETNFLRRYDDREEFELAVDTRKEDLGETPYDEEGDFEEEYEDDSEGEDADLSGSDQDDDF